MSERQRRSVRGKLGVRPGFAQRLTERLCSATLGSNDEIVRRTGRAPSWRGCRCREPHRCCGDIQGHSGRLRRCAHRSRRVPRPERGRPFTCIEAKTSSSTRLRGPKESARRFAFRRADQLVHFIPPGMAHTWQNIGETTARFFAALSQRHPTLSVNVRRDAHHRGINDLEGENGERRTCWSRVRTERRPRMSLLPAA